MDGQDHKKLITSSVHEVHGVHLCNRCGWPFPNPHPSAKHRRAHKRVCGKVEGYKMSPSDLAISDDEHASDEDEQHTPSPTIEKSNLKESNSDGGVRLRSNKSEDDVFSDAVTDFSESGISPSLEERLGVIRGDDKKIEQKSVEGDINVNLLKNVDECADITEKLSDPRSSDQMCTGAEAVSLEPGNHLQPDDTKYDSPKSVPIQVEGDKLASVSFNSKEEKASDPTLMPAERKEAPHDKLDGSTRVSDTNNFTAVEDKPELEDVELPLAGKSDKFVPRETSADDVESSKEKCSVTTVSIPVFHNSSAPEDDSTTRVLEENANHHDEKANCELPLAGNGRGKGVATEEQLILDSSKPPVNSSDPTLMAAERKEAPHDKLDGSTHVSDTNNFTAVEDKPELEDVELPLAGKSDKFVPRETSADDVESSKEKCSVTTVSIPVFHNSSAPEDDSTTRVLEENANHHDEKANCELPLAGNGRGKGVATEEQLILDSSKPPVNSSDPTLMAAERKEAPHDKLDGSTHVSDTTNFTAVEDKPELEDVEVPLAGKSDKFVPWETSADDVESSKEKCSVTTVPIPVFHNSSAPEDDSTTRVLEENANHHDEKANCELPLAGNGSGKGVATEEQIILDSSKSPVNSSDPLPSGEVDVDPRQLESLSKTDSGLLEFKDADFMRSRQGFEARNITGLDIRLNLDVPDVVRVKSAAVTDVVDESNHDGDVAFSEKAKEQLISKPSNNPFSDSAENYATINSLTNDVQKTPESINVHEDTEQKHDSGAVILPESSDSSPLKVQETPSVKEKCLLETDSNKSHATEDFSMPVSVSIVETPDKISHEDSLNADKKVSDGEKATVIDSKSSQDEGYTNDKLINEKDNVSAADSLEGKWGSISAVETNSQSSPRSETNMQNSELRNIKVHQSKSDDFEPPSFMTLVQPGKTPDSVAASTASEIEPVQFIQQQKSESLQAGWFPTLTNVVNDSQGRKKNEEIIAKVTNWNAGKEHHSQLKNLLNEAKSPNLKQQKDETPRMDNGADGTTVSSVVEPEEPKLEIPHKEDWNSPARYPTVIKKEKKKGKPYWVPFACCSSVNRDL